MACPSEKRDLVNYLRNLVLIAVLASLPFFASISLAQENKLLNQPATTDKQRTQEASAPAVNHPSVESKVVVEIPRTQWCQCVRAILGVEGGDIAGCVKSGASEEKLKIFRQRGEGSGSSATVSSLLTFAGCSETENQNVGSLSFDMAWKNQLTSCEAGGISAIHATLYRHTKAKLASINPWDCSNPVGTLNNIPTGSGIMFVITGKNASGSVLYRAEQDEITITYGQRTALGTITALPFVPVLSAPQNGALLGSGRVRFAWTGVSGATSYQIQVSDSPGFSPLAIDTTTGTASYETTTDLTSNTYYWRVKATDAFNNTSEWSSPGSITVDTEPPTNTTTDAFINKGAAATNAIAVSLVISAVKKTGVTGYFISERSKKPEAGKEGWVAIQSTPSYTGEIPFSLSNGDGNKKISVWFKDALGHVSLVKSGTILFDTKLPQTTITSHPSSTTNSTTADFTYTSTKAKATFQCQLDDGVYSACTGTKSYEGLLEGQHTFSVKATDAAGNTDLNPASFTWIIDLTPPKTTITEQPPVRTESVSARFSFTSTEPGSTFQCQIDGNAFAECASPKEYPRLAVGQHTFAVRATDAVGNIDPTPPRYNWTITPLFKATITDHPSDPSDSENAGFSFTSSRPGATFECKLDNGMSSACTSPLDYSGLIEGRHTFRVRAIDAAENEESEPAYYTWAVSLPHAVDISRVLDEMPFPDTPAFTMLSEVPRIIRPATGRELAFSFMEGSNVNGSSLLALSVDMAPYFLFSSKELSLKEYQDSKRAQDLSRIQVSLAYAQDLGIDADAKRFGAAVHWKIWDDGDIRLDNELMACLDRAQTSEITDYSSGGGTTKTIPAQFSRGNFAESFAQRCGEDSYRRNWNKSAADVGIAQAWIADKANGGSVRMNGIGVWASYSYGFDGFGKVRNDSQIVLHARYITDQTAAGGTQYVHFTDRDIVYIGAKYRWSDDTRRTVFLQDMIISKKTATQSRVESNVLSIGAEIRGGDNLWAEVETGLIGGYGSSSPPGFFMVQIKMAFPESKATK
jgi:hypothetical protein